MPSSWERICSVKALRPIHRAILDAARFGSVFVRSTVLVDTGFLVALFDGTDTLHESEAEGTQRVLTTDRRHFYMLRITSGNPPNDYRYALDGWAAVHPPGGLFPDLLFRTPPDAGGAAAR